jgi:hypothetical protein
MVVNVDDLLPLSRRLDWRFLLPDPTLDHIKYAGPPDSLLAEALGRFATSETNGGAPFGVVVMVNPSVRHFTGAIAEGQAFYAEFNRPRWLKLAWQWLQPRQCLRAARAAGFEADAYWHYPDFDSATRIIPLSSAGPLLNVVAKSGDGLKARARNAGIAMMIESGLLKTTVPCLSIAGARR